MGRREAIQRIERIKAETRKEMEAVEEAGGNIKFLFAYHKYLNDLQSEDHDTVAKAGQRFLRRPLQIAAVAAMKEMVTLEARKDDLPDFDENLSGRWGAAAHTLGATARTVYVSAAGHHEEQTLAHLPETGPEAMARRQKAAADWDRLLKTDLQSLAHISIWGREPSNTPSMTLVDHIKGIGGLIILICIAVFVYYYWGSN